MPIDIHAHYVPRQLLDQISTLGNQIGVQLEYSPGAKEPALAFSYGFKTRPLFSKLLEGTEERRASLDRKRIYRQLVATWPDIYGYGLGADECVQWHRLLNDTLAEWCNDNSDRFSFVASVPLVDPKRAASELTRAVQLGAVSVMVPANIEGTSIGESELDPFWSQVAEFGLPVVLHPVLVKPEARTSKFGLTQIAQYTFDTTVGIASILATGVLDRFPTPSIVLSHGGGTFPYLLGRFDVVTSRIDPQSQQIAARRRPSEYAEQLYYDSILHSPLALRFLIDQAGIDRVLLGSDESFLPADEDPLATLSAAGLSPRQIAQIADENPRRLFPSLKS